MSIINKHDLIDSIADALQYISYYHPLDFIQAIHQAYKKEESPSAKDALAQILVNSRMCAEGQRPVCQDTGIVTVFMQIGMDAKWDTDMDIKDMVNEGVRLAYTNTDNVLRASIMSDPAGIRNNTGDNTPAVIHLDMVAGDTVKVNIMAKGGGSENKSKFVMLNPSDDIANWVVNTVSTLGAGWCPPGILGIGIGGTAEKALILAKESLLAPIDIQELKQRGAGNRIEELRLEIYDKANELGIGAQGLGGLTTVLDVKILDYPTHAASLPVALIPNCAATRHTHFTLDGNGPFTQTPPNIDDWPDISWQSRNNTKSINLDNISRKDITQWNAGETLLLSGKLLTGRDAAHKRICELLVNEEGLPDGVDFNNRFIYYVGPVSPVRDEIVGPAGPTTATRMDKFTELMLSKTGLIGMIGKAERGPTAIEAIKKHNAVYLVAVGGAAYLVSKAITSSRIVAFEEMGMEAIHEFAIKDMPVTVAVDSRGNSIHEIGPTQWKNIILKKKN